MNSQILLSFLNAFIVITSFEIGRHFAIKRKIKTKMLIGLAIFVVASAANLAFDVISLNYFHQNIVSDVSSVKEISENKIMQSNIDDEEKEKISAIYARLKYINNGVLVNLYSIKNGWHLYCPSKEDAQERVARIESEKKVLVYSSQVELMLQNKLNSLLELLIFVVCGLGVGFYWGNRVKNDLV